MNCSDYCILVLELLSVDKAHQRQGAGLALMKRGTDKADELGIEVCDRTVRRKLSVGSLVPVNSANLMCLRLVADMNTAQAIVESAPMVRRTYEKVDSVLSSRRWTLM